MDIEKIVNEVFNNPFLGILQIKEEITKLLKLLKTRNIKVILEIGSARGGTLMLFYKVLNPIKLISIDKPQGLFGGTDHTELHQLSQVIPNLVLIEKDSHLPETIQILKKVIGQQGIDFLFIDGDHSFQGVKKDFEMYSPLVNKGGIIAFHDIVRHSPSTKCEVDKLWKMLKDKYNTTEIIKDPLQNWGGIGIIFWE